MSEASERAVPRGDPDVRTVLSAVQEHLGTHLPALERLVIQQATPTKYGVRVFVRRGQEPEEYMVTVDEVSI